MSETYRQSALLLHGVSEIDRQWILSQLEETQRVLLSSHLTELAQMGMPADRSLAEDVLSRSNKSSAQGKCHRHLLRDAAPEVVLHLLRQEPSWLIAAVLSVEAWPWRETIYMGLDASKRDRVKQSLRTALPRKLGLALIDRLESRLPEAARQVQGNRIESTGPAKPWQQIARQFKNMAHIWR